MFYKCKNFNKPLNNWDTREVTDMSFMFFCCVKFNKPLHKWKTYRVTNMSHMFTGCKKFNKPLNNWITSQVTDMSYMFLECPIKNDNKPIVKPEKDYKKEKLEVEEELIKQHLHPSRIASIINSTTDGMM